MSGKIIIADYSSSNQVVMIICYNWSYQYYLDKRICNIIKAKERYYHNCDVVGVLAKRSVRPSTFLKRRPVGSQTESRVSQRPSLSLTAAAVGTLACAFPMVAAL